ncbi:MAG TPA: hypothetical protein VNN07_18480 [Candidatus Tectomicrobia bacterium]|nr:hypothetical protein [Candidatus Tectomicrobia bacterium]
MNLFRSEEHAARWAGEHGVEREILTLEQALEWIGFVGRGRLDRDYVHPRATGALGPFIRSLGLTSPFWAPPRPAP